jgi:hypothetical protein
MGEALALTATTPPKAPIALTAELPVLASPENVASRQDSAAIIEGRKP